jgi:hypothetical protein
MKEEFLKNTKLQKFSKTTHKFPEIFENLKGVSETQNK